MSKKNKLREYLVPMNLEFYTHVLVEAEDEEDARRKAGKAEYEEDGLERAELINWELDGEPKLND